MSTETSENILNRKKNLDWTNVSIIHAFNFNSLQRKNGFLFYKIFNSLINSQPTNVGNLNISRDLIHPKYLVNKSLVVNDDSIIVGSGKLTNIESFISELFTNYGMDYKNFIISDRNASSNHLSNQFWLDTKDIYDNLLYDTIEEIENFKKL